MRKYISVFNVIARSSFYKILLLLAIMSVVEIGLYTNQMHTMLERYAKESNQTQNADSTSIEDIQMEIWTEDGQQNKQSLIVTIEDMFSISHTTKVFTVTFVLISIILCLTGCNFGSRQDYTWKRLQVTEQAVFLIQTLYNCMVMMLFIALQIMIAYGLCRYYVSVVEYGVTSQSIFLAFYRSTFLHSILPLEASLKWIANGLTMLALGFAGAMFPYRQRRQKISIHMIFMVSIACIFFPCELGKSENSIILIVWSLFIIVACLCDKYLFRESGTKEGEANER